jgi:transcriptional regulator with XRE-family HTH domain
VTPDGVAIRRMRRARAWSRRRLVRAIGDACSRESGRWQTISINLLEGIEEINEPIPYATLCRVAAGLDCDPIALVVELEPGRTLH